MDFAALMASRWSCREYLPEPLPEETVTELLTTAQRTASWCNTQPWQVHLLDGDALDWFAKELGAHAASGAAGTADLPMPAGYSGAYADRRRAAGYALYESLGIERSDFGARAEQMLRNFSFFGAPHAVIVTTDREQGVYGAIDCGGYVANLMNAALDLGVGSIAQGAIAMYADQVRELLGLPEDRLVVCAVAFGRPATAHPVNRFRTERSGLADVVTRVVRP
ncbi:nitroreductase [Nocardioides nitrophenolicus]|uniref:nitroreductase n=1 Tax=Nocardioides nitrophenolicus TaxID=60489 RepID=UPI001EF97670|nr:nitroreductase [Nocardioides nitrophenolicus]MBM7516439.1 nitroreductase [Nocardioides nitrophenolicus]